MTPKFIIPAALSLFLLTALLSCQSNSSGSKAASGQASAQQDATKAADSALAARKAALKVLAYDYKKDPSCGMPLTAGIEDTLHYKGKLYGFCSKECKDAFLKDPASYLAQVK